MQAEKDGFRGFVVEFYNIISDVVVQDGYQSVLNLRTTLNLISKRHSRIKRCSRETDGAGSYNSVFVALMTLQLGTGNQLRTNHTPIHIAECTLALALVSPLPIGMPQHPQSHTHPPPPPHTHTHTTSHPHSNTQILAPILPLLIHSPSRLPIIHTLGGMRNYVRMIILVYPTCVQT